MDIELNDLIYPAIVNGAFSVAMIILLWICIRLLKEILVELRKIRDTIHSTASSDIELRISGDDE